MVNETIDCEREKQENRGRMTTMQIVRAMLAAKELTHVFTRICEKEDTIRLSWWRGRRMMISVGLS